MAGLFDQFRKKIISTVWKEGEDHQAKKEVNDLIALGVLLWEVAEADEKFLPEEKEELKGVLKTYSRISDEDMPIVLRSIEEASLDKIDLFTFTSEVSRNLPRPVKIGIVESLFRVACIDRSLANDEHEMIRKIASLFHLDHGEFIDAKIKVKREFGMDTAD